MPEQTIIYCMLQSLVKSNNMERNRLPFFKRNVKVCVFSLKVFELFKHGDYITSLAFLLVAPVFKINV